MKKEIKTLHTCLSDKETDELIESIRNEGHCYGEKLRNINEVKQNSSKNCKQCQKEKKG